MSPIKPLIIALSATLLCSTNVYAQTTPNKTTDTPTYTQIKIFTPWGYPPSAVSTGLKVIQEVKGSCWTSSIANPRPDAWRCSIDNAIQDPCFSNVPGTTADQVACVKSPWDRNATIIKLTKPLPEKQANAENYMKRNPWAIEFSNGTRCIYDMTGTVPVIAGLTTSSTCFDAEHHLLNFAAFNSFDRTQPLWKVFVQQVPLALEQMPVKTAWY